MRSGESAGKRSYEYTGDYMSGTYIAPIAMPESFALLTGDFWGVSAPRRGPSHAPTAVSESSSDTTTSVTVGPIRAHVIVPVDVQSAEPPQWLVNVVERTQQLLALPGGWDTYGSERVTYDRASEALVFLLNLPPEFASRAAIMPLSTGGVQLEWHQGNRDLELTFEKNGVVSFYFADDQSGEEIQDTAQPQKFLSLAPTLLRRMYQ